MKFRKKPIVIEAVRFFGNDAIKDVVALVGTKFSWDPVRSELFIHTREGTMKAQMGDWVIKGVKGEFYPCANDVFEVTYEQVPEEKPV